MDTEIEIEWFFEEKPIKIYDSIVCQFIESNALLGDAINKNDLQNFLHCCTVEKVTLAETCSLQLEKFNV